MSEKTDKKWLQKFTPKKRATFLAELAESCNVSAACDAISISRVAAYKWRRRDPKFAEEWRQAIEYGVDTLEKEVRRRALDGVTRNVHYKGVKIDTLTEYSDTLAIFLLKAHRPEKFKDRQQVEHGFSNDQILQFKEVFGAEWFEKFMSKVAELKKK